MDTQIKFIKNLSEANTLTKGKSKSKTKYNHKAVYLNLKEEKKKGKLNAKENIIYHSNYL